jgi:hypothetical protein
MPLNSTQPRQAWISSDNDPDSLSEGPWLEFVNPLLAVIAEQVRRDPEYIQDDNPLLSSHLLLLNAIDNNNDQDSCILFKGHIGSGKTSFIDYWIRSSLTGLRGRSLVEDGLVEEIRWNEGNLEDRYASIAQGMACRLYEHGRKSLAVNARSLFHDAFVKRVLDIRDRKFATTLDPEKFLEGFTNQSESFLKIYPGLNGVLHLAAVVSSLCETTGKSTWLILDNVDLLGLEVQRKLFSFADTVRRDVLDKCQTSEWQCRLCVMTVVRHETAQHHKSGAFLGFDSIDFPPPALRKIAMSKVRKAIEKETRNYDRLKVPIGFQIGGRSFSNWHEFGIELIKKIDLAVAIASKKQNDSWHNAIVSHNARRFFNHWTRIILSKIAASEWLFSDGGGRSGYNEYERLLFRGGRPEYPGMSKFNPAAENSEGPLFVNLFHLNLRPFASRKEAFSLLWAPIRLLQYVNYQCKNPRRLDEVIRDLARFYDKEYILACITFCIWARLIDETESGARNIGNAIDWRAVKLEGDLKNYRIVATNTTELYADELLIDFNFVSSVSVVSLIDTDKIRDRSVPLTRMRAVPLVYRFSILEKFYETLLVGMIENLRSWKAHGSIEVFEQTWMPAIKVARPWLDGIQNTVSALEGISGSTESSAGNVSRVAKEAAENLTRLRKSGFNQISNFISVQK